MQGSQDKLKQLLEGKLFDHEAAVSRDSRDTVLSRVRSARKGAMIRKALYSTSVIVMIASVTYYTQVDNSVSPTLLASSVSQPITKTDASQTSQASLSATQQEETSSTTPQINETEYSSYIAPNSNPGDKVTAVASPQLATNISKQNSAEPQGPNSQVVEPAFIIDANPQPATSSEVVSPSGEKSKVTAAIENDITIPGDEQKAKRKVRLSIGLMPTLNYKHIVPNSSDNAYIYDFQTPSSFDASRFGVMTAALAHFEMRKGRTLYTGLGYLNYKSQFSYSSSELGSNLTSSNEVNETVEGFSIVVGGTLPLMNSGKRYFNLNLGSQLQIPKAGAQFVLQAGIEYGIRMNERNTLIIQPVFFHAVTPLHYTGLIAYPYGGGVDFRYQFSMGRN